MKPNNTSKSPSPEITVEFTEVVNVSSLERVKQLLVEAYLERIAAPKQK